MKREFLTELGIDSEAVEKIMREHGKTVNPLRNELETAKSEKEQLKEQAEANAKALKDLKAGAKDSEELTAKIETLQKAQKELVTKHETELAATKKESAVKLALAEVGAHDTDLLASQLDLDKVVLDDTGTAKGLEEQLANLREHKAFLFKDNDNTPQGAPAPTFRGVPAADGSTAQPVDDFMQGLLGQTNQ